MRWVPVPDTGVLSVFPENGEQVVSVVAVRHADAAFQREACPRPDSQSHSCILPQTEAVTCWPNRILPEQSVVLTEENGHIRFTPPQGGEWSVAVMLETPTGGTIRGLHFGEDDGEPGAPPAADLLNPQAVQAFLEETHERYAGSLSRWFGGVIIGFFTDEPSLTGRNAAPDVLPWTGGFLDEWRLAGLQETELPLLWLEAADSDRHLQVRCRYREQVARRLDRTYYAALSSWCGRHDLLLAGHPESSMDVGVQNRFGIPGQDLVWRWVAPEGDLALYGPHSTMAKSTADAARWAGKRRNANECFGCCGPSGIQWGFSADDMKWMLDWLFLRGTNLIIPHAFHYSVDGPGRYGERPPDVGPNSIWWPEYGQLAAYIRRMSWLRTESRERAHVGILCRGDLVPWQAAACLYQHQLGFHYVEEAWLEHALIGGRLPYEVLLVEEARPLREKTRVLLGQLASTGVLVLGLETEGLPGMSELATLVGTHLVRRGCLSAWPLVHPAAPSLRMADLSMKDERLLLLVNEGEAPIHTELHLPVIPGSLRCLHPWKGTVCRHPFRIEKAGRTSDPEMAVTPVCLERRESMILHICQEVGDTLSPCACGQSSPGRLEQDLSCDWNLSGPPLPEPILLRKLEAWETRPELAGYCGVLTYRRTLRLTVDMNFSYRLDCGKVGELVRVRVNGQSAGTALWAPYVLDITQWLQTGENHLELEVANSLAHRYEADLVRQMAGIAPCLTARFLSGLLGPVWLYCDK